MKICEKCHAICFAGVRTCPDCGTPFPEPELMISGSAATTPILPTQIQPEWYDVRQMYIRKHKGPGKPPSMKESYATASRTYDEYVCLSMAVTPAREH